MVSVNTLETEPLTIEKIEKKKRDSTRAHLHSIPLWDTNRIACVGRYMHNFCFSPLRYFRIIRNAECVWMCFFYSCFCLDIRYDFHFISFRCIFVVVLLIWCVLDVKGTLVRSTLEIDTFKKLKTGPPVCDVHTRHRWRNFNSVYIFDYTEIAKHFLSTNNRIPHNLQHPY